MYVNCMLTTLRSSDLGCHLRGNYVGCIMYADDLLLISASMCDLQSMFNMYSDVASQLAITFNASKSKCIVIGPTELFTKVFCI